jgi:polyhydroxyalkanoate synthesis regulator phasin
MEDLLKEEQVTIGVLDQKAQKHLKETMEAHDEVDARVDDCAKLQADLERLVSDVS